MDNCGNILNRRRNGVMGIAALMVIIYHCFFNTGSVAINFLAGSNTKIGVDVFVFLSGFGISQSLIQKPGFRDYYIRRLRRLLPSYYIVLAGMLLLAGRTVTPQNLFRAIIPLSVWTGNEDLWYVSASLGYYLLIPLFAVQIRNAKHPRICIAVLAVIFALAVPTALTAWKAEIALMRIPSLILGTGFGIFTAAHDRKEDRAKDIYLLAMFAVCGAALGISKFDFGILSERQVLLLAKDLIAPALAILLALMLELLEKSPLKFFCGVMNGWGKVSLELYLGHLMIKEIVCRLVQLSSPALFAVLVILAYPAAWLLYRLSRLLLRAFDAVCGKCSK